jgi:GTP-binding protein HflX
VQLPDESDEDHEADLVELGRLVTTLGYRVEARVTQRRESLAPAAVLGEGKLRELALLTGGKGVVPSGATPRKSKARERMRGAPDEETADDSEDEEAQASGAIVVVDHEISPSQARNLERATGARVLDRTGIIVEIFHKHARSREARLEVEIARLTYVAPRLRESGNKERQRGKGAGEKAVELDRRKIRDRIAELRRELDEIGEEQKHRRALRKDQLRVALVGYTNAGKSSLMRALTASSVLVEDKLFATLDTTVRALSPETKPRILLSDTVGFIKKLPHDLVASFRSTLDEALEASLLLYVVDASDPACHAQLEVTRQVLGEIGATSVPSKLVLNKRDRLDEEGQARVMSRYRSYGEDVLLVSAVEADDIGRLRSAIITAFEDRMLESELMVPYAKQAMLKEVYESARVVSEQYDEVGTRLKVRAMPDALARLAALFDSTNGP